MSSKETTHIRIRKETKDRLEEIRRLFTIRNEGEPVTLLETLDRIIWDFEKYKFEGIENEGH